MSDIDMAGPEVDACVIGGGPAGMVSGLLLARRGLRVVVLEKHPDFLRDFRGDTVHPSTLRLVADLGIIDEFLALPHVKADRMPMQTEAGPLLFADFTRLPGAFQYLAFMPQWDVLNFLAEAAAGYPGFHLVRPAEVVALTRSGDRVDGVVVRTGSAERVLRARIVIAADGRNSLVRRAGELPVASSRAPMDVLWFRLGRRPDDTVPTIQAGTSFFAVCINRGDYWQIAYMIPKGRLEEIRRAGLATFRRDVASAIPLFADRLTEEITEWADVHPLDVRLDRLRRWYRPGLLAIGDAAHAMSPAGGVGINLAVQDAVAAARIVGAALRSGGDPDTRVLRAVQRRRELPARVVQLLQSLLHADLYPNARGVRRSPPRLVRLVRVAPAVPHLLARVIGLGVRPEPTPPAAPEFATTTPMGRS